MKRGKIHMIISVDKEKSFNTIQHPFMIKVLKTKTRRQHPHFVKQHVWKLIVNIPESFPHMIRSKKKCPLSLFSSQHCSGVPRQNNRERKKGIQVGKEQVELLIDNIIFYIVPTKESTRKIIANKWLQKIYKIQCQHTKN